MTEARLRAVFFDVGGTLIRPSPSVGAVYAAVAARYDLRADADSLERAFHSAWKVQKASGATSGLSMADKDWWRGLVYRTLDESDTKCSERVRAAYFEELYEVFARPQAWQIYPDVVETLKEARARGLHVGVISNWDARLRPLLKEIGLGRLLDSMTISCEVGAEKPGEKIFRAALRAAKVQPQESMHTGDNREEDVKGAAAVGMRSVLIDRAGRGTQDCVTVRDLREIIALPWD